MVGLFLAEHFPVLVIVLSLLSAFTLLLVGWWNKKACLPISLATISVQLFMAFFILQQVVTGGKIYYRLGGWAPPWGIEYVIDAFNAYVLVIVLFICLLAAIFAKRDIEHKYPHKTVTFYVVFQLLVTGLCGITVTGDIFNLYVFLEISALAAYALIAVAGGRALKASYNYVIMGSIGACFYLLGVGFLYAKTGTLNMADMSVLLTSKGSRDVFMFVSVLFIMGFGLKAALVPFHAWLPDAHPSAPAPISAMLSGVLIKSLGVYAICRVFFNVLGLHPYITTTLLILGTASMVIGVFLAIGQQIGMII